MELADALVWLISGILIGFGLGFSVGPILKYAVDFLIGIKRSTSYFSKFHVTYYLAAIMILIILVLVTR